MAIYYRRHAHVVYTKRSFKSDESTWHDSVSEADYMHNVVRLVAFQQTCSRERPARVVYLYKISADDDDGGDDHCYIQWRIY